MSYHHININQLTNIEANYYLGINARECARRMKIGKDKVYNYYRLLKKGFTVEEIYSTINVQNYFQLISSYKIPMQKEKTLTQILV